MKEDQSDIRQKLATPFPPDVVEQKDAGHGNQVDFVPWHEYARRLNDLAVEWSVAVDHVVEAGGKLLLVVNVTVDGDVRSGTGSAKASKDSWGGAHSEAFSQAFRRACAMHGLGLYFYGKEAGSHPTSGGRTTESSEPSPGEPTEKQLERIRQLLQKGPFTGNEAEKVRQNIADEYTKANAGRIVRKLKASYEHRVGKKFDPEE